MSSRLFKLGLGCGVVYSGLYLAGYQDEVYYISTGFTRAARCGLTGAKIFAKYKIVY